MPCFCFSFIPSPQSILCISTFISRCSALKQRN